ncbi:MAG TPA: hypothetical protein VJQ08_09450 [Candidatus Dormibacteraeota bacterium]|nr:hypothetical protein [Candidatus Dormibacteraeota bacterium]
MPSAAVLGPVVLPLIASGVIAAFGLARIDLGRPVAAVGAWSSVLALGVVWLTLRSSLELALGQLGYGSAFDLRIDAVTFAFGLMISIPTAVLLSLQPRAWPDSVLAMLGLTSAMAALEAGGVVLTAIAGGTAATLAMVLLDTEDPRAPRPSWGLLLAGWLALAWLGVIFQVSGGTAVYAAVPVTAVSVSAFALLAVAAVLASCLFPWRTWPAQLWSRPSLRSAGVVTATLYPLGFYLLVRGYELGGGRYPHAAFNVALAVIGAATALGAGARAQAAATRREFLGEVISGFGGFALIAISLGTPLGLAAGIVLLATAAAFVACLALLPDRTGIGSLLAVAAAVGLPPGISFGGRVIGIEATFEAGDLLGLIGIAGAAVWAVWMVGAARAIGLPGGRGHPANETFPRVAMAIALATLIAGPALALFQLGFASPVVAEVMPQSGIGVGGGVTSLVTVSSVLPVVSLLTPLLLIGVGIYLLSGSSAVRTQARPAIFALPTAGVERVRAAIATAAIPEQYRSILDLRELEAAAVGGRPVLWLAAVIALAFAVTR